MRFYREIRLSMKRKEHIHPSIDPRTFKRKNSRVDFLCPLCGVKRSITKNFKLTRANYVQICVLAGTLMFISFSFIGGAGLIYFPVVFCGFEFWKRFDYKREIPCESCGFDAIWYKKDVPRARKLVHEFWEQKETINSNSEEKKE